ncbi:hypothetical protein P152DRAFT_458393 [Eremomyces bilateralis CBS 781.70]|uniref:FAD-binding domain-containing protein n=1 Tax=Eremomyces bilateralis CBS 781.70 TaxID=1392243 RepID=A0A6G1G410_9PEZI|nr:uncharacterized protein P152DRAFT_458393 [Eremomyces bilateralis CBS 781.70]KAF1812559.1 hypothetical protein P152DRAFT_458393 [Eremomyces bilateralis CBS 781.70]
MQPDGLRTFIRYGAVDWVLVYRFNPEKVQPSTFTEEECSRHIQAALGKDVEFEILSITIWSTTPRIVESYRSSLVKNAFLAGDSAHTFSPTGGLGQNTGFGDVHNLVWKLLMVMNGHALDILMDSYDEERITVAVANARQSTVNEAKMDVLGQTINPASERGHGSQEWENEDFQYKVREAIQHNADHFDSLDLQLGMIYNKLPRPTDQNVSKFVQKAVPGARLPHAWVEFGGKVDASSLDLVGYSDLTLLCPDLVLAHELESRLSANVRELVQIKILGSHFTTNNTDWLDMLFTTQRNRAVLVRPDQHIASLLDSTSSMVQAFRSINLEVPNPPSFS